MAQDGPGETPAPSGRMRTRPRRGEPRAPTADPRSARRAALEADLETAALDAVRGGLADRATAGRIETAARAVLHRHGLGRAHLKVSPEGGGMRVMVRLPGEAHRVETVIVRIG